MDTRASSLVNSYTTYLLASCGHAAATGLAALVPKVSHERWERSPIPTNPHGFAHTASCGEAGILITPSAVRQYFLFEHERRAGWIAQKIDPVHCLEPECEAVPERFRAGPASFQSGAVQVSFANTVAPILNPYLEHASL